MKSKVTNEIVRLAEMLEYLDPGVEYDETVGRIRSLLELEVLENKVNDIALSESTSKLEKILNNAPLLNLIGSLVGIVLVINHERINIITSRAFSFIRFKS